MTIKIKRVYEPAARGDGVRILVDRLWPRGVKKDAIDLWLKDIAPSNELRNWFHHEEPKWASFRAKYRKELAANKEAVAELRKAAKGKIVTLLYGAKDEEHNQAVVIAEFLKR
jgi:DNA-3-methyladenine glycosylase